MNYLLDTCVLSEYTRRKPDAAMVRWVAEADESTLYLSAISIGEIKRGIERLPDSRRKEDLRTWFNDRLVCRFEERILPLDEATMLCWGNLTAQMEKMGRPLPAFDSLIAATALTYQLVLVTRNVSDFENTSVQIINPWSTPK